MCSMSSFTVQSLVGLFVCICLSVMLANVRDCVHDFAVRALDYKNVFDSVGQGKVCTRVQLSQIAAKWRHRKMPKSKKRQKLRVFAGRGRQNKPIETKFGT